MRIDRTLTLENLRDMIRLIKKDDRIEDGGAFEFIGEIQSVIEAVEGGFVDEDVVEIAESLALEEELIYETH